MQYVACNMIPTKFQTRKTTNDVLLWTPMAVGAAHIWHFHRRKRF